MSEEEALKALQFTSNVIELKPGKKYLLVFKHITLYQIEQVNEYLRNRGFDCACISAPDGEVQVIEAPS